MILSRLLAAGLATAGLLVAWAIDAGRPIGYPLVQIDQGVTAFNLDGAPVFAVRNGAALQVLGRTTVEGSRVLWCPNERFFVAPSDASLFTRDGEWVAGPSKRDMASFEVNTQSETLQVFLGEPTHAPRATGASVEGAAGEAYRDWAAAPDDLQKFCQNPVG